MEEHDASATGPLVSSLDRYTTFPRRRCGALLGRVAAALLGEPNHPASRPKRTLQPTAFLGPVPLLKTGSL